MSLRSRVLAGTVVVALVLVGGAVVVLRITEAHLIDQTDHRLEAIAREMAPLRIEQMLPSRPPTPELGGNSDADTGGNADAETDTDTDEPNVSSVLVALIGPEDEFAPLEFPEGQAWPDISAKAAQAAAGDEPFTIGSVDSDLRWRAVVRPTDRTGVVVLAARPLDDVDAAVDRLLLVELLTTGLILLALGLVTWWVVHLGVRPIKRMTTTASRIAGGDLTQRIGTERPGTEAGQLGRALNTMLGRIEQSFARQIESEDRLRRFVADASHELRTPLATVRGYAELYRQRGLTDPDDMDDAMRRTEQEALRMSAVVDDLLQLARRDEPRTVERQPVNLARIVWDAARDARTLDPSRRITVAVRSVSVAGDKAELRRAIANVVGNALVHTPAGTAIDLWVGPVGDRAEVEVTDHGPGMAEADAARAFERFYRPDAGRSRQQGAGSGLGLAIVQSTVAAHHGTVNLTSTPAAGTTVHISLPRT